MRTFEQLINSEFNLERCGVLFPAILTLSYLEQVVRAHTGGQQRLVRVPERRVRQQEAGRGTDLERVIHRSSRAKLWK